MRATESITVLCLTKKKERPFRGRSVESMMCIKSIAEGRQIGRKPTLDLRLSPRSDRVNNIYSSHEAFFRAAFLAGARFAAAFSRAMRF